jgi:hypothetical protein
MLWEGLQAVMGSHRLFILRGWLLSYSICHFSLKQHSNLRQDQGEAIRHAKCRHLSRSKLLPETPPKEGTLKCIRQRSSGMLEYIWYGPLKAVRKDAKHYAMRMGWLFLREDLRWRYGWLELFIRQILGTWSAGYYASYTKCCCQRSSAESQNFILFHIHFLNLNWIIVTRRWVAL